MILNCFGAGFEDDPQPVQIKHAISPSARKGRTFNIFIPSLLRFISTSLSRLPRDNKHIGPEGLGLKGRLHKAAAANVILGGCHVASVWRDYLDGGPFACLEWRP